MWAWTQPPWGLVVLFSILKQFDFKLLFYIKNSKLGFQISPLFFGFFCLPHIFSHCFSHMHARPCFTFINKTTEKVNFFLHRELNENKPSLLSVLYPWSFANNNVGFICCVGLKMLSQCQATYQAAGLQMFWIFQLFVLSFLVSQRLMRTSSSNEKLMEYWKQQWQLHNLERKDYLMPAFHNVLGQPNKEIYIWSLKMSV